MTGLFAFGVEWGTDLLFRFVSSITTEKVKSFDLGQALPTLLLFICVNGLLVLGSGLLVVMAPLAAGSGVPEIKCYLNGSKLSGLFGLKELVAKTAGVILAVASGLAVGKEGPMIHIGAILASGLSQGKNSWFSIHAGVFDEFRNDRENRDFVAAGVGAGISAAFGAPVGGILFALEEGASFWDQALTFRAFFCSALAAFSRDFFLSGAVYHLWFALAMTQALNFGAFTEREHAGYSMREFPFFLLLGVVGGVLGAAFVALSKRLSRWRSLRICTPRARLLELLAVSLFCSAVIFTTPFWLSSCRPVSDPVGSVYHEWVRTLGCPGGGSNDMATLLWNRPEHTIKLLFHAKSDMSIASLLGACALYMVMALVCLGLAVPSGLFIPSLMAGALYGRLTGKLLGMWLGADVIEGTFALIGAASFLGGTMRMNLSITVILVETTNDLSWLLPILLAVVIAKSTADWFNSSVFDETIKLKGIPFLEYQPSRVLNSFQAQDVMTRKFVSVGVVLKAEELLAVLENTDQYSLPVVDFYPGENGERAGTGALLGVTMRETLAVLLSNPSSFLGSGASLAKPLTLKQLADAFPNYPSTAQARARLTTSDLQREISLVPYMNRSPVIVHECGSLGQCYSLFRSLGIRHITVVDHRHHPVGIITRKDLLRFSGSSGTAAVTRKEEVEEIVLIEG
jgi:chloride channel 7